jgi:small-conductance mechanosensitive channel
MFKFEVALFVSAVVVALLYEAWGVSGLLSSLFSVLLVIALAAWDTIARMLLDR